MNRLAYPLLLFAVACGVQQVTAQSSTAAPKPPRPDRTLTTAPPSSPPEERPLRQREVQPAKPRARAEPESQTGADSEFASSTPAAPEAPSVAEAPRAGAASRARVELVVASIDVAQGEEQRAFLLGSGAQLLRRRTLANLGWVVSVFRLAPGASASALSAELATRWPDAMPEPNQRYQAFGASGAGAPREYARALIEWPVNCAVRARVAMLDGPVNRELSALRGKRITMASLTPPGTESNYQHGTALASLLLGHTSPTGLLPESELFAGVIMAQAEDGPYSTTEWVLRGLDWALGIDPRPAALNLSFGGPRSAQIERALRRVLDVMPVVAAAGNSGKREVTFPAGYEGVIGVAAADANSRRWARANTGSHVTIAAPGVQVWALDAKGAGYYADGTSIAAIFVSAALALRAGSAPPAAEWLRQHTRDAGPDGQDLQFGHGVLAMNRHCPGG